MAVCSQCERPLTGDEISVYRKLVNREAASFLCKTCLAEYFGVTENKIDEKIRQFKRNGCLLFNLENE
jgi:hypothetical protein